MSCSYSEIAIEQFDKKALILQLLIGKGSRWHFFSVALSAGDLNLFFSYMNNIERNKKIQFTIELAEDVSEFPALKLTFDK